MNNNFKDEEKNPILIEGGISIDDRGEIGFVNEFDMKPVKRFYTVSNHKSSLVRAWHAHKKEEKFVTVFVGSAIIAAVRIDDWQNPSKDLRINKYVLSAKKPSILFIPSGHANGFMNLTKETKLMFFSSFTLEESLKDDYRFESNYWNPWDIIER